MTHRNIFFQFKEKMIFVPKKNPINYYLFLLFIINIFKYFSDIVYKSEKYFFKSNK